MIPRYGTPCGHYTGKIDGQDTYCGAKPTRHFLTGHRCRVHTPARLAGKPEVPRPDPKRGLKVSVSKPTRHLEVA
ncbi:hypothetical protein [Actinopolymorpha pittospori]|uniref:Uncharacterized protein n=1 Tax=Actinopolymorpha pittospori TaxID=648752 RepID=A0A927N0E4_9ACTN|nr:hypothetical protein [Actinopolymorpha pittospori]MBE1609864.1 hypothetical protein [Actinopolymorpha pittospori]